MVKTPQQVQSQEPTRGVPGDLQRPRLPAIVFQPGEVGGEHILKHVIMEIIPMSPAQAVGDVGLVHRAQSGYVEMRDCIHSAAKTLNPGRKVALFPVTEGVEVRSSAGLNLSSNSVVSFFFIVPIFIGIACSLYQAFHPESPSNILNLTMAHEI